MSDNAKDIKDLQEAVGKIMSAVNKLAQGSNSTSSGSRMEETSTNTYYRPAPIMVNNMEQAINFLYEKREKLHGSFRVEADEVRQIFLSFKNSGTTMTEELANIQMRKVLLLTARINGGDAHAKYVEACIDSDATGGLRPDPSFFKSARNSSYGGGKGSRRPKRPGKKSGTQPSK
jgi:hypothetical protein